MKELFEQNSLNGKVVELAVNPYTEKFSGIIAGEQMWKLLNEF